MAWYKFPYNNKYKYKLTSSTSKVKYHKTSDVSLEEMNDPKRDWWFHDHGYFIREGVKETNPFSINLPADVYTVEYADREENLTLIPWTSYPNDVNMLVLESNKIVFEDFKTFTKSKDIYKSLPNKAYKKGILLYGPPGTGKTSLIMTLINNYTPIDSLVLCMNKVPCQDLLDTLFEDPRLKVIIFEEIIGIIESGDLAELLTFLDGEKSLENCYIIASTNYPEKLPENLTNRQGRFDVLYEIGSLNEADRKTFLSNYYPEYTTSELSLTKNFSIVQLTEVILLIRRDKLTFEEAINKIKLHEELSKTKFKARPKDDDLLKDIL